MNIDRVTRQGDELMANWTWKRWLTCSKAEFACFKRRAGVPACRLCVCVDTVRSDSCHSEVMLQQRSSGRRGNIISRGPGPIWLCNGKCNEQNWPPAAIVCLLSVVLVHECMRVRVRVCVSQRVPYLRARLTPIFMGFLPSLQPPPPSRLCANKISRNSAAAWQ